MQLHSHNGLQSSGRLAQYVSSYFLAPIGLVAIFGFLTSLGETEVQDVIIARKIILVDKNGTQRIAMLTDDDLAKAPFAGEQIPRNVPPNMAGVIFMNPDGDEVGGIGFGGDEDRTFALNALDYTGIPLEAIGFNRIQTADSSAAQFIVLDGPRPELGFDAGEFAEEFLAMQEGEEGVEGGHVDLFLQQVVPRVNLGVEDHNAALSLMDTAGKQRIVLEVDADDQAILKILDSEGEVVYQLPPD